MNRYAQVLTASALAYTAQASATAKWARGTTMSSPPQFVATAEQLVALTKEPRARHLVVCGNLANVPSFRLAPGQTLTGNGDDASISFVKGVDGLQLSSDNEVRNLRLEASAGRRAIFNDTSVARLGTIRLIRITTVGQVQLIARDTVRSGHVEVDGLDIMAATLGHEATAHAALVSTQSKEHSRSGTRKPTKAPQSARQKPGDSDGIDSTTGGHTRLADEDPTFKRGNFFRVIRESAWPT